MTDGMSAELVELPKPVALRRNPVPGEAYPEDVVERTYEHWAMMRNAEAVAAVVRKEMIAEYGEDVPTPTARCIRKWVAYHAWPVRADGDWRRNQKRNLFEMQAQALAGLRLGLQNILLAATGTLEINDALVRLKASEQSIRLVERGVIPLSFGPPDEESGDDAGLTLAEKEARASARIVQDRKRSLG